MKVLIVNKFLHPNGGSETYIFEVGKQLQKMGHQVEYFGMEHEGRVVSTWLLLYREYGFSYRKTSKITVSVPDSLFDRGCKKDPESAGRPSAGRGSCQ